MCSRKTVGGIIKMALSFAIIVLGGMISSWLFRKIKLPGLLGMLILGIIIGPYTLNLLDESMLNISGDLRKIALIVILLRAGLGISKSDIKEIGATSIKMSIIPGILEGTIIAIVSTRLLGFSIIQGGMLGFIICAVSPAVIVPSMLKYIEAGVGSKKKIPTLILAAASVDDVVAITIFSTFLGLYGGGKVNIGLKVLSIPLAIILGVVLGLLIGFVVYVFMSKVNIMKPKMALALLSIAIIFNSIEKALADKIEIATLLGVMAMGYIILEKNKDLAKELSSSLSKIWILAEIILFVLVGAQVNPSVAIKAGGVGLIIITLGLMGRSIGVWISTTSPKYNTRDRLFCVIAYIPKATVQAAIGSIPLSAGVAGGEMILAIAVLSILITAPLGAIGINISAQRLLDK